MKLVRVHDLAHLKQCHLCDCGKRERESVCVCERERETMCVCLCKRETMCVCVSV